MTRLRMLPRRPPRFGSAVAVRRGWVVVVSDTPDHGLVPLVYTPGAALVLAASLTRAAGIAASASRGVLI